MATRIETTVVELPGGMVPRPVVIHEEVPKFIRVPGELSEQSVHDFQESVKRLGEVLSQNVTKASQELIYAGARRGGVTAACTEAFHEAGLVMMPRRQCPSCEKIVTEAEIDAATEKLCLNRKARRVYVSISKCLSKKWYVCPECGAHHEGHEFKKSFYATGGVVSNESLSSMQQRT